MKSGLFDTNVAVDLVRGKRDAFELFSAYEVPLFSAISLGELYYGAYKSADPSKHLQECVEIQRLVTLLPITVNIADVYGNIKAALKSSGQMIPENDIWIAATAIAHDVELVTQDKHFKRVEGITTTII